MWLSVHNEASKACFSLLKIIIIIIIIILTGPVSSICPC